MRRFMAIAICGVLALSAAYAQKPGAGGAVPPPPSKQGGKHQGAKGFLQELNLTPAQQERIRAIMKKYGAQVKALKTSGLPKDQIMAKMQALKQAQHNEIRAVLTPAQQARWDEMMKKRANNKKGGDGGRSKPPPPPGKKGGG